MKYKVINAFRDKEDNNTHYKAGDMYPKGKFKPTKKRFEELSKKHAKHKVAFIEEVKDKE